MYDMGEKGSRYQSWDVATICCILVFILYKKRTAVSSGKSERVWCGERVAPEQPSYPGSGIIAAVSRATDAIPPSTVTACSGSLCSALHSFSLTLTHHPFPTLRIFVSCLILCFGGLSRVHEEDR